MRTLARILRQIIRFILLGFVLNPLFWGQLPIAWSQTEDESSTERAQALLETLTPEERVGQLFLVTFQGNTVEPDSPIYDLIFNRHIGGVVLNAESDNFIAAPNTVSQVFGLTRELQATEWSASQSLQIGPNSNQEFSPAFIPMFIGISQEGNGPPYDNIFNGVTSLPAQMAIGATWEAQLAQQAGHVNGSELSAMGINLLLGPSLDVLESPQERGAGDLGVRSFGGDPYWVGEMGRSYIAGVHQGSSGRIAVIAKHFPGHGSSDRLPEEEVATVRKALEQLKQIELAPFYAVTGDAPSAEATTDGLLSSHIRYQGFQGNIRETTRPVSLDRQALEQLMGLPPLASWRENGGLLVSDNLGSRAFRRFIDPSDNAFQARFIARDAFLAGNDLLYLGNDFIATEDQEAYPTVVRTLQFFAQKYREDPAFQQQVDASVLRILTIKYRLYNNILTLNQTQARSEGLEGVGKSSAVTFEVAQQSATLVSPSLADLAETLPQPPNLNDRIVFVSDVRKAQQCSQCPEQDVFSQRALEQAVFRLYGPLAGGQVLQRNLVSYSFEDLEALLDQNPVFDPTEIESDLTQANWIVFSLLDVSTNNPTSQALSRFLAERPDLFRQKNLVVFAFDAPYSLDATEISKLNAYFALYSKTPQFVEIAARLLFGELPTPPGDLPVSVSGVNYDLISATAPDPSQTIQLFLDLPDPGSLTGTATVEPLQLPNFRVGDLIPIRTGVISDYNGHPVPDNTPVQFIFTIDGREVSSQTENSAAGIARSTFLIEQAGTIEVKARSNQALDSTILQFEIPPEGSAITGTTSPEAVISETVAPSPTITPTPRATPVTNAPGAPDFGDWLLASLVAAGIGIAVYWMDASSGMLRWGIRSSLLAWMGGLAAYIYLALDLPGTAPLIQASGSWGVLLATLIGCGLGWGIARAWQRTQGTLF